MAAQARIVIKGENQLKTPLKDAQNDLSNFQGAAASVASFLKGGAWAVAIAAAIKVVKELGEAVGECVDEFKNQIEVDTKLSAIIKATNQEYIATTSSIKKYASALQEQTRFGDEVIEQSAALLLATQKFSKEGLERTLSLSADLAEAMGTDLTSATSTLSKALIEPGEGLNRLRSIGISFTDSEEELIKKLHESGAELEAQSMILDKVEKAYGGVAKSIGSIDTSKLDKIKNVWGDLKQDLGNLFTNVLGPVFDWIYKTLVKLERFANKVANNMNFKEALASGSAKSVSAFDTEYLREEMSKRNEDLFLYLTDLEEEYANTWSRMQKELGIGISDFLDKSNKEQLEILQSLYPNNPMHAADIANQVRTYYTATYSEIKLITEAIALQEQAAEESFKYISDASKEIANSTSSIEKSFSAIFGVNTLSGMTLRTGTLGPSAYMNSMYGTVGTNFLNSQAFMANAYDWNKDLRAGAGKGSFGHTFTIPGIEPLTQAVIDLTDTMSILGPEQVKKYLDMGSEDIDNILAKYGSMSEDFQMSLLDAQIEEIQNLINNSIEPGTDLYTWFSQILDNLKKQRNPDNGESNTDNGGTTKPIKGAGGLGNIGEAVENLLNAGAAVWEDFKSQAGEAGDVINRLTTNMTAFGPALGAIVTALHYVIQGFVEVIQGPLNDFITWGLEPIREIGRALGQIFTPIIREIMPSVVASGKVLMQLFQALARLLTPIVSIIMKVIGPVLTVLADVIVSIVGTISWAIDMIAYGITWVLNKISFGGISQTAYPGDLASYVESMYSQPGVGYDSLSSSGSVGTTNASYSGGTVIHLNVYQQGVVCGDNGILEFATMIKNELADAQYLGR